MNDGLLCAILGLIVAIFVFVREIDDGKTIGGALLKSLGAFVVAYFAIAFIAALAIAALAVLIVAALVAIAAGIFGS